MLNSTQQIPSLEVVYGAKVGHSSSHMVFTITVSDVDKSKKNSKLVVTSGSDQNQDIQAIGQTLQEVTINDLFNFSKKSNPRTGILQAIKI